MTQSSRYRSILRRPMTNPVVRAMKRPEPMYRAATFQPNRPKSRTRATSLTMGAETRNEKVTPNGTPAVRKPINSGTAEHEQKGARPREGPQAHGPRTRGFRQGCG